MPGLRPSSSQRRRCGAPARGVGAAVAGLLASGLGLVAAPARAAIAPAGDVAGPSPAILGVGNVALAPDGTGGVVWREITQGQPHVFVSRFAAGRWGSPIQVDEGQTGPASYPEIAAADGGELLVVWVQPGFSVSTRGGPPVTRDELVSAVLGRGASSFAPTVEVDPNVMDGTGVSPSLAMAANGSADVAYRVVENPLTPGLAATNASPTQATRPGDELVDVRVARFNGLSWSSAGVVNNYTVGGHATEISTRPPTTSNAPQMAVDARGDALVAWQEATADGVAHIYARRIFGTRQGTPLEVSPQTLNGQPVTTDADSPAVSLDGYGGAIVAFRLQAGAGSPYPTPELFANVLPSSQAPTASSFDGGQAIAAGALAGSDTVSDDDFGRFQVSYNTGTEAMTVTGDDSGPNAPSVLGAATGQVATATVDPAGGDAAAWPSTAASGLPDVAVDETLPNGGYQTGALSAPISGPVSGLSVAPSGDGDGLIAFQQGSGSETQIAVADFQAPPQSFTAGSPTGWVRARRAKITWQLPGHSLGPLTYSVLLDGHPVASGLHRRYDVLTGLGLSTGRYRVRVAATDDAGQTTVTPYTPLKLDTAPPTVRVVRLAGARVRVIVADDGSGADAGATRVGFGDDTPAVHDALTVTHAYVGAGRFEITVRCADYAGNRAVDHLYVRAR